MRQSFASLSGVSVLRVSVQRSWPQRHHHQLQVGQCGLVASVALSDEGEGPAEEETGSVQT